MRPTLLAFAVVAAAAIPAAAAAQRVLAPTSDATTLRRGMLRTSIVTENVLLTGRWSDGAAEPLGAGLSADLDGSLVPAMQTIAGLLAGLGHPDERVSLGRTETDLRQRFAVTRLGLEYGITDRLMLKVQAPFVRARAEAQVGLAFGTATAGPNPIFAGSAVAAQNRTIVDAYAAAASSLATRRDACIGNVAAHPECATILAEVTQVNATITRAAQFAAALSSIYGAQGLSGGLPYVPGQGTGPESLIRQIGNSMIFDFDRWGVTAVDTTTGYPLGAQTTIPADVLAAILSGASPDGLQAKSSGKSTRQNLGDVDIGLTFRLYGPMGPAADSAAPRIGIRQTLVLTYRLGGGHFDLPDDFIDLGTGSGHDAIALHANTDVVFNEHWWATLGLGWVRGAVHERDVRLPLLAGVDLIGLSRQTRVRITPAQVLELRIAPRWTLNDYFGLGGEWRYRRRGPDVVEDLAAVPITPAAAAAPSYGDGALNAPSDSDEQRWAWTLAYSTMASNARGKAGLPLELFYTHEQSIASSHGIVPRRWEDRIQIRYYTRLFGR